MASAKAESERSTKLATVHDAVAPARAALQAFDNQHAVAMANWSERSRHRLAEVRRRASPRTRRRSRRRGTRQRRSPRGAERMPSGSRAHQPIATGSLPDNHPQRRDMERKLRVVKDKLRAQERDHEASR
jgi:hypothetical protein